MDPIKLKDPQTTLDSHCSDQGIAGMTGQTVQVYIR